jgi:anti-anti-sigma factor
MPGPLALIEDAPAADVRVLALRGELDVGTTPALRDWLAKASEGGRRPLAVDLSSVDFMAVSSLYVLCDEQARMARHRAQLTLVCPSPRLLELIEVCQLTGVLRVVGSRAELDGDGWSVGDDQRTERLRRWLTRYASGRPRPGPVR